MISRTLAARLSQAATQYPVLSLTGPRQSGKTTLAKSAFPTHAYVSLEAPDAREFALSDPKGFLAQFKGGVILDEVQRTPELFSYIQGIVDEHDRPGEFILTGSQNFLISDKISQSLAGRAAILHLLPFSRAELTGEQSTSPLALLEPQPLVPPATALWATLFAGFYPRIHDKGLPPQDWLGNYVQTYLERDVRQLINVGDLEVFARFLRLCAGRNGQILDYVSLGNDCGVSNTTAKRWLSVLEASFLVKLLRPHHANFNKRLIKSPKLYFLDTGLLCYLLGIRSPQELEVHSSRGAVFEAFAVSEFTKHYLNRGEVPPLFYWRDSQGNEIDILIEAGCQLLPIEVKSGQTVSGEALQGVEKWLGLAGQTAGGGLLFHGGEQCYRRGKITVQPWHAL